MADGGNWGWIGTAIASITAVITGGTALNSTYQKVKTHDRILFKEKGGLNIVAEDVCKEHRKDCHKAFAKEVEVIFDRKFRQYSNRDRDALILSELKKLNEKEG